MQEKNRNQPTSQTLDVESVEALPSIGADVRMRVSSFAQTLRNIGRQASLRSRFICRSFTAEIPEVPTTVAPRNPEVLPTVAPNQPPGV
jgi:hypothetical protein